ncbi:MAG: hypothetical protein LBK12_04110 [Odoribacteraceae bacterium]|jgi:hypothetical protein|nr:hypothetical protein [Odoribacteraceae bacterium]
MKKILKIMASTLAIAAFAVTTISCGKDDDDEPNGEAIQNNAITIVVENGGGYGMNFVGSLAGCVVKLEVGSQTLAETLFGVNGFTLKLPASVDASLLDEIGRGGILQGLTVSNPKVKMVTTWLRTYQSEERVGEFYHGVGEWKGYAVYADGNVNITGSFTDNAGKWTFNAQLKKGWNVLYEKMIEKENRNENEYEAVTRVPEGASWRLDMRN